jgi:hypothetical protein
MNFKCSPRHFSSWTLRSLKVARAVVVSLTGTQSATVKCHKGCQVSPQVRVRRIQMWRVWRSCSGPSSNYPSAMGSVIENISCITAAMCRSTIVHAPHLCSFLLAVVQLPVDLADPVRGYIGSGCL